MKEMMTTSLAITKVLLMTLMIINYFTILIMTIMSFHVLQSSDLLPLAMVMLFDFQDRRFLLCERSTKEGEEPIAEVRALESSLHRCVCVPSVKCLFNDAVWKSPKLKSCDLEFVYN